MSVLEQGKLLDHEEILTILGRLEAGERIEHIFGADSQYPRFAFADFRRAIRGEPYRELYESIQILKQHQARARIQDLANGDYDRHEVPEAKFKLDAWRHLEMQADPENRVLEDLGSAVLQAAVVFLPPKAPKGLAAQRQLVIDQPSSSKALPEGDT